MGKKYWIYYSSSVLIEAENAEEAENLFRDGNLKPIIDSEIDIDAIEEVEDD